MKKILLIVGVLALSLPAVAAVSTKEAISPEYLNNYGISDAAIEYVQMQKSSATGVDYQAPHRKYSFLRRYFRSYNPAMDLREFNKHDIKFDASTYDF